MTTPTPTTGSFEERLLQQLKHVVMQNPVPDAMATRAPRPAHRRTRLALSGAGLAAAVAVAVVLLAGSGGVTTSAYAVTSRPNGTVTVAIHDLRDAGGLERELRAAGIPANVDYVADPAACRGPATAAAPTHAAGAAKAPAKTAGASGAAAPAKATGASGAAAPADASATAPATTAGAAAAGLRTSGSGGDDGPSLSSRGGGPPPSGAAVGMGVRTSADGSATFELDARTFKPGETLVVAASTGTLSSLGMAIVKDAASAPGLPCVPVPDGARP